MCGACKRCISARSYDVHLVLQQENGTWKIVSTDGI